MSNAYLLSALLLDGWWVGVQTGCGCICRVLDYHVDNLDAAWSKHAEIRPSVDQVGIFADATDFLCTLGGWFINHLLTKAESPDSNAMHANP